MRLVRPIAALVLHVTARYARDDDWPRAMRNEMRFIASDWAALLWALGSSAAILRTSPTFGKNIGSAFFGIGIASALAAGWMAVIAGAFTFFKPYAEQTPRLGWAAVILVAIAIYLVFAARLWRTRRPAAIGLLVAGAIFSAHFVLHVAGA